MTARKKNSREFLTLVRDWLAVKNVAELPDEPGRFLLSTAAGPMDLSLHDDQDSCSVYCRFRDVARATSQLNQVGGRMHQLNRFSGKWNFHWNEFCTATECFDDFIRGVKDIYPITSCEDQESA
jgi:hypothetical protein